MTEITKKSKTSAASTAKISKHYSSCIIDDSCVLCGFPHVETGRILHGHCVCENCVDYIIKNDSEKKH